MSAGTLFHVVRITETDADVVFTSTSEELRDRWLSRLRGLGEAYVSYHPDESWPGDEALALQLEQDGLERW